MHRHEVAQGVFEQCQARSTGMSGDPFGDRIHRSNLCDHESGTSRCCSASKRTCRPAMDANPSTVAAESQAHYQNRAAGG